MKTLLALLALAALLLAAHALQDDDIEDIEAREEEMDLNDSEEDEEYNPFQSREDRVMALRQLPCRVPGMSISPSALCTPGLYCKCSTYRNGRKYHFCC